MPATKTLKIVRNLLLVAAILLAIWSALWAPILFNRAVLVWKQDDYRRGTLLVETTSIETIRHGHETDGFDVTIWWANGTVRLDGEEARGGPVEYPDERVSLKPIMPDPGSPSALASKVPAGTNYDVWFHPGMPRVVTQDESLRVVLYEREFFDDARRMRNGIALRTVVPLGGALVGCAALTWVLHRGRKAETRPQ